MAPNDWGGDDADANADVVSAEESAGPATPGAEVVLFGRSDSRSALELEPRRADVVVALRGGRDLLLLMADSPLAAPRCRSAYLARAEDTGFVWRFYRGYKIITRNNLRITSEQGNLLKLMD